MNAPGSQPADHVAQVHTGKNWGGGEHQIFELIRALIRRGQRTTLIADRHGMLYRRVQDAGFPVLPITSGYTRRRGQDIVRRFIESERIDLLHLHDSGATDIGAPAAKRAGIPVVYSRRIASPLRRSLLSRRKYSARNLTAVIAISETVRNVFLKGGYPPTRLFVVPDGIEFSTLDEVAPNPCWCNVYRPSHVVGGIGTLSKKKNWQMMIPVAATLKNRGVDIHWLLAGTGPEEENLKSMAQAFDVIDRFHFLGFIDDGSRFIKSLDALFFPSLMEGASVTIREAMALSVPVITADTPGSTESLDSHGWVFAPEDVEQAAQSVLEALTDQAARSRHISGARSSALERFNIDQTAEKTLEVYLKATDKSLA